MTRQCKNFIDVIKRMSEYGFEFYNEKRDFDNKVCLYFKGVNIGMNMQYIIGNKFNVYRLSNKYDYTHFYEIKRV